MKSGAMWGWGGGWLIEAGWMGEENRLIHAKPTWSFGSLVQLPVPVVRCWFKSSLAQMDELDRIGDQFAIRPVDLVRLLK